MTTELNQPLLAMYWIPDVGIGPHDDMKHVQVPLTDVLNYVRPDGQPQTTLIFLFNATFTSNMAPYIDIPTGIIQQMKRQPGQSQTAVQQLQAAGVKVLLSLAGSLDYGWDTVGQPQDFAAWVQAQLIDQYGLDGIDIDNETTRTSNPQSFVNTIGALRTVLTDKLITKALWNDLGPEGYFTTPVTEGANTGRYLGQLLDLGSTMSYGLSFDDQIATVQQYANIPIAGNNVGMQLNQLAIGVQAGPPAPERPSMTSPDEVYQLARWCVAPDSPPIAGMMGINPASPENL